MALRPPRKLESRPIFGEDGQRWQSLSSTQLVSFLLMFQLLDVCFTLLRASHHDCLTAIHRLHRSQLTLLILGLPVLNMKVLHVYEIWRAIRRKFIHGSGLHDYQPDLGIRLLENKCLSREVSNGEVSKYWLPVWKNSAPVSIDIPQQIFWIPLRPSSTQVLNSTIGHPSDCCFC